MKAGELSSWGSKGSSMASRRYNRLRRKLNLRAMVQLRKFTSMMP